MINIMRATHITVVLLLFLIFIALVEMSEASSLQDRRDGRTKGRRGIDEPGKGVQKRDIIDEIDVNLMTSDTEDEGKTPIRNARETFNRLLGNNLKDIAADQEAIKYSLERLLKKYKT